MSILIRGMEMPTSCDECRIMVFEDTNCEAELYCGCPIVFKTHPQGVDHRPDYCPLVPVPPHGRLIDADELHSALRKRAKEFSNSEYGEGVKCGLADAREYIKIAPTIIPAEEGET